MEKMKTPPELKNLDMDAYVENAMKKIKDDIEFYEMIKQLSPSTKLVKENITKFLAYQDDFHYCKNCPGISKCQKATPHLKISIKIDGPFVDNQYLPCDKLIEQVKLDSMYLYSDFPDSWRDSNSRNIDNDSLQRRMSIKSYLEMTNSGRWIYIWGQMKTGKSYVASAFANDYVNSNKKQIAFIDCGKRFEELSTASRINKEHFEKMILNLSSVPLLVLDGFGNEFKNDYIRDSIVLPILLTRSKNKLPVIFTSTFSLEDIEKMYSTSIPGKIRAKQLVELINAETSGSQIEFSGISKY